MLGWHRYWNRQQHIALQFDACGRSFIYSVHLRITGKPKGMAFTAGYMVYAAYTFKNIFQYEEEDIYWCTADIDGLQGIPISYMAPSPMEQPR